MPCTLPLLVAEVNLARPATTSRTLTQRTLHIRPKEPSGPTLIISCQLGWVGAARAADFLVPADLAVEDFFAADIAPNSARKC